MQKRRKELLRGWFVLFLSGMHGGCFFRHALHCFTATRQNISQILAFRRAIPLFRPRYALVLTPLPAEFIHAVSVAFVQAVHSNHPNRDDKIISVKCRKFLRQAEHRSRTSFERRFVDHIKRFRNASVGRARFFDLQRI